MAGLNATDHTANNELPEEDTASEEADNTPPGRRCVEALLDISEEVYMDEMEPYEYHCYCGWEEAVRGWARVAPLSAILVPQKTDKKPKHKNTENQGPMAGSSTSVVKHDSESHVGSPNICKKPMLSSQQMWSCNNTAASALKPDALVSPALGEMPKIMEHLTLEDKTEDNGMQRQHLPSKYSVVDNKPPKTHKHSQKVSNTLVPIKNFTFLPPIKNPQMNSQRVSGQSGTGGKPLEADAMVEKYFLFDKMSGMRGTNPEIPKDINSAAVSSRCRTRQHNLHYLSAVNVSVPKRYPVPVSPKPETLHPTSYSMGKSLHSGAAGSTQIHMHPSCLFS